MRVLPHTLFVLAVCLLLSGCGYHIAGKGGKMPGGITSMSIPIFSNETPKPNIESAVTSAFSIEFVTAVHVEDTAKASLVWVIKSYGVTPVSFTANDINQESRLTVALSVKIIDKNTEKVLWSDENVSYYQDFAVVIGNVSASQDAETTALVTLSKNLARLVKERVLENF